MLFLATLVSLIGVFLQQRSQSGDLSLTSSIKWFALVFIVQLPFVVLYNLVLYPLYLSPLRRLPQAPQPNPWKRMLYEPTSDDCIEWMHTIQNDGLIRYFGAFNSQRILVTNSQGLNELLQSKSYLFVKSPGVRRILVMLLGNGLVVSEGAEHKFQRKNLSPAFSFRRIKDLYPTFWGKASELCLTLDKEVCKLSRDDDKHSAIIEITEWHQRVTLDIICLAGFGDDSNVIQDPESSWYQNYKLGFVPSKGARQVRLLALLLPGAVLNWLPLRRVRDIRTAQVAVKARLTKLLIAKRETFERGEDREEKDMISRAIRTRAFSDTNLLDQSMTMIAAGHETTSAVLSWAAYVLSQNPVVQSRLRDEIRAALPSPSKATSPSPETLDSLAYLHACCSEVLRLYTPIPILHRSAAMDTTILDTPIPKGTNIRASCWAFSRSEHSWGGTAQEFIPDRWLEREKQSKGGSDSNYGFMAFSYGSRSCIGASFARAELAACLACLVGRFDIKLDHASHEGGVQAEHGITAKINGPLHVRLTIVDGW